MVFPLTFHYFHEANHKEILLWTASVETVAPSNPYSEKLCTHHFYFLWQQFLPRSKNEPDHLDIIFEATAQAIEEAIINAMIAAQSMTTVKPPGYTLEAIDHDRLKQLMRHYGRLNV